jgi:hypothetical protein
LLSFLVDNFSQFKDSGIFEETLIEAFTGIRTNNSIEPPHFLKWLFSECDRVKLRRLGSPIPDSGPVEAFRGVAGHGRRRRLDGGSWTLSLDAACWFATRWGLANPAILTATVDYAEVFCHWTERDKDELIVWPKERQRLRIQRDEIDSRAARWGAAKDKKHSDYLAELLAKRTAKA